MPDEKLNALAAFTRAAVCERGWVSDRSELKKFFAVGYTKQHALEAILGFAMKTLSNYTNHLTDTPVDAAFATETWEGPDDYACCNS